MVLVHGQEALVLGVLHVLIAPEQGELVLVGTTLLVGAEHGAVAALVAHAVDVDDLMLGQARTLIATLTRLGHTSQQTSHTEPQPRQRVLVQLRLSRHSDPLRS